MNNDTIKHLMSQNESATVVTPITTVQLPGATWQPIVGQEARDLVKRKQLSESEGQAVIESAASILARGVAPTEQEQSHRTGLVVGYVQSGKTLSFTTVIALARDNDYRLIIAVAGTSNLLLDQSTSRLHDDLNVDGPGRYFRWSVYKNPEDNDDNRRSIDQEFDGWRDPGVPSDECPTVLITVMKHHRHLKKLVNLLKRLNLDDVPTLIIDDEADQASLNTLVKKERESTTYRRLMELRETLPCHTFLQYTATPQAPLLINIIDSLSPDFVEVLEPGSDYVGGRTFFIDTHDLVKEIPDDEFSPEEDQSPSPSLLDALRVFLVGVAAGWVEGKMKDGTNRSMLVHPSRKVARHEEYKIWINHILADWRSNLKLQKDEYEYVELVEDFKHAHRNLSRTVPELPTLDQIMGVLPSVLRYTRVEEINTRTDAKTPTIEWKRQYGWILVGGQAMDRGFTVEGLTVTYMPRGTGMGNVDTIQQRGRFFGYKRPYLGYCRIYLEQGVLNAFESYVEHEEYMRQQLKDIRDGRKSLKDWKRAFVLDSDLKPCRNNVLQYGYARGRYADRWFIPNVGLDDESIMTENRDIVRTFLSSLTFTAGPRTDERDTARIHHVSHEASLSQAIEQLLIPYRFTVPRDTERITGLLLQLEHAIGGNPNERCVVYRTNPGYRRRRTLDDDDKVPTGNLFSGPIEGYIGDGRIRDRENVTIQIHLIDLMRGREVVANNVPGITIWVPKRMALDWIAQEQT